jgi:hypothetical protein
MKTKYMFVVTAMAVMLVGATAFVTGNAYAKYGSQATSQVNKCGNGYMAMYVFCENTDSQVQGEDNGVYLSSSGEDHKDKKDGDHKDKDKKDGDHKDKDW